VVNVATPLVFTVNVPTEEFAAIEIVEAGNVAAALSELSEIVTADGAFAFSVTVPRLDAPPTTDVGSRVKLWIISGVIVRSADEADPL